MIQRLILIAVIIAYPAVASAGKSGRSIIESGIEFGSNYGEPTGEFSRTRLVTEYGYLVGAHPDSAGDRWGFGGTVYVTAALWNARFGIKPRVRYKFHPKWSTDVSAGWILVASGEDPDAGFVGGIGLNYSSWLTLKADVNVKPTPEWHEYRRDGSGSRLIKRGGSDEVSVYTGLAFRDRPGEIAAAVSAVAVLWTFTFVIISLVGLGGAS